MHNNVRRIRKTGFLLPIALIIFASVGIARVNAAIGPDMGGCICACPMGGTMHASTVQPSCGGGGGGGGTPYASVYNVLVSANSLSGHIATITWSTSPSSSCDRVDWGSNTLYGNTIYPPCGTHSGSLSGLQTHQTYFFQITATAPGYISGTNSGSFYPTDVSVSKAYEGYTRTEQFTTLCGAKPSDTFTYSAEAPGDIMYDPAQAANSNHYQVYDMHLHFDSLGQGSCWPNNLAVKYTQVDLWAFDPSGVINFINGKGNIIWTGYAGGSATISWSIFFQGGSQNGQAGFSTQVTPSSTPTADVHILNTDQGGGWKYIGYFRFSWPTQIQVSFDVIVPLIVTDQLAQYRLGDMVSFQAQYQVTFDTFGWFGWNGHDITYTYSFMLGDGDYNGANQLDQYTDVQQGVSNGPVG